MKWLLRISALILLLSVLTACGPSSVAPDPTPADPTGTQTAETPPADEPGQVTEAPPDTQAEVPTPTDESPVPPPDTPEPADEPSVPPSNTPEPADEPSVPPSNTPEPSDEPSAPPSDTPEPTDEPSVPPSDTPEPTDEPSVPPPDTPEPSGEPDKIPDDSLSQEADALIDAPAAIPELLIPSADGLLTEENSRAVIDYSHREDGYVMVKYTAETSQRLKVRVFGPQTTYTYNLPPGMWEVFPLSDGSGSYRVAVYLNVSDSRYSTVLSLATEVSLIDEFAPFLRPNQYVNYSADCAAVAKAAAVTAGLDDPLKKVEAVYDFVVAHLTYDREKAASVQSGYLPDLDQVLEAKKGICFDYAALMTAMLRSQGVPCKLVVGYAGTAYHAWINVWTEEQGWVDGVIFFDGHAWHRMDPTFASSADQSAEILQYIGDGTNYTAKYLY